MYDRLPIRIFEFVPLWQIAVFFVHAMRRVDCPKCGVIVEEVPWSDGKNQVTSAYRWFLAGWARRLSWLEVANGMHECAHLDMWEPQGVIPGAPRLELVG